MDSCSFFPILKRAKPIKEDKNNTPAYDFIPAK